MKSVDHRTRQAGPRQGMALVIVLSAMALLMVLVLAMLVTGRSEVRSASAFSKSVQVRGLADLPVNLVMAQIRKATSNLGATHAWTSQPGMIRVFGTEAGLDQRAALQSAWKLYSADQMVTGSDFDAAAEANSLSAWKTQPGAFTDLNEPVAVLAADGSVRRVYPILDPAALGKIDGFALSGAQAPGSTATQPLPMPVRWLYLLQDGRLVLPTKSIGTKVLFDKAVVTTENPIVGRIAFWTDDESCKVNINTASEGTPWDVPRTTSWTDRNYGRMLPTANEFQRFPGHPATTCLSTVLQAFDDRYRPRAPVINEAGEVTNPEYTTMLRDVYALLPRTNYGDEIVVQSSRGGAARVPESLNAGVPVKRERLFATVDELFLGSNRTVNAGLEPEEIQMGKFFLAAHSRAPETNLFNRPRLSLWPQLKDTSKRNPMDKLIAFCATASQKSDGKAQEHGYQRDSVWTSESSPGSSQSSSTDYLLPHNQQTFAYLQDLTSRDVPGFTAASFAAKYSTQNRYQILLGMFDLQRWGVNSWYSSLNTTTNKIELTKSYYYTPPRQFRKFPSNVNPNLLGTGTALPTSITSTPLNPQPLGDVKAVGRFPTISEVVVVFMASRVQAKEAGQTVSYNALWDYTSKPPTPLDEATNLAPPGSPPGGPDNWADNTIEMQAYVLLQPYTPVAGMPGCAPNVRYMIEGLEQWTANGVSLGFPDKTKAFNHVWVPGDATSGESASTTAYSGFNSQLLGNVSTAGTYTATRSKTARSTGTIDENNFYPFVGTPVNVSGKKEFTFSGGTLKIKTFSGFGAKPSPDSEPVQEIHINFPPATLRVPRVGKDFNERWNGQQQTGRWPLVWKSPNKVGWLVPPMSLQWRVDRIMASLESYPYSVGGSGLSDGTGRQLIIGWGDTVRSVALDSSPGSPTKGDLRLLAAQRVVPITYFAPHPDYGVSTTSTEYRDEVQSLRFAGAGGQGHFGNQVGQKSMGRQHVSHVSGTLLENVWYSEDCQPAVPRGLNGALNADGRPGDWDNGPGRTEDGPYINKPDEGGLETGSIYTAHGGGYFERAGYTEEDGRSYSPNRQICSAVAFGSLPTGVYPTTAGGQLRPWQTLLFCPHPPSRSTAAGQEPNELDHFGFKPPRDHLLLDLYWMPVVEPYAISEPFSTAGKTNLNCQMMPFSFIQRTTGLHAVMRGVRVSALPASLAAAGNAPQNDQGNATLSQQQECYKSWDQWLKYDTTYEINAAETLKGIQRRFDQGDVFHSASEICDIFLVPQYPTGKNSANYAPDAKAPPASYDEMTSWWNGNLASQKDGFELTGDNTRESPYNQIYPRLTTRSNVFQVHYRVQAIRKARSTDPAEWDEAVEKPAAELRGSTLIERYLDPNDPALPNFVETPSAEGALDDHYRFRIIRQKQFAP